ncbi:MAG: RluA family pseudouridine synthase [Pseudomonadota bacterium]
MKEEQTFRLTVPEGAARRLDRALTDAAPEALALSRGRIQALIGQGAVLLQGRPMTDASGAAVPGVYELRLPPPAPADVLAEPIPLNIVFEDADLIVIDKAAGMVVHPAPGAASGTLVNALLAHCGGALSGIGGVERPGIVHRIDKDTSGLLVVAKSDRAHTGLAAQFAAHSIERIYAALCRGLPRRADPRLTGLRGVTFAADGALTIDAPLGRHKTDRKKMAVRWQGGRRAVTHLAVAADYGRAARLNCRLETGRTHQIRVHAAYAGHPLLGDPVYGGGARLDGAAGQAIAALGGQALHAQVLGFLHPISGAHLRFEAPPPPAFSALDTALAEILTEM